MSQAKKEPSNKPVEKVDSKLMTDALESVRFLVNLREAKPGTIPNEEIQKGIQKMVDDAVIDVLAASVTFTIELIKNGHIIRPGHYTEAKPESRIIVPGGHPH